MTTGRITTLCALLVLVACNDSSESPAGVAAAGAHAMHGAQGNLTVATATPFTYRAPLEPFQLHQLPDFLLHSKASKDVVFQQSIFQPGSGPWHTHPGPSFVYVVEGQIKRQRYTSQDGCSETPVVGPGNVYMEVADEVHRAVVVSATPALLLVVRLNIPVGGAFTIPAADPGC
jgi:quercetin dioxygenase-like cupin family protein